MPQYEQVDRTFILHTHWGEDALVCKSWTCTEAVSSLFELRIVVMSQSGKTDKVTELLLQTVSLECPGRFFTGIVRSVERLPHQGAAGTEYVLHVVPPAWLLTVGRGYSVYQDVKTKDILQDVMYGLDAKQELQGEADPIVSRTQFDESPWAFVSRLMEREGIWYTFLHTREKCSMLVANSSASAVERNRLDRLVHTDVDSRNDRDNSLFNLDTTDLQTVQSTFLRKAAVSTVQQAMFGKENREVVQAVQISNALQKFDAPEPRAMPEKLEAQVHEFISGPQFDAVTKSGGNSGGATMSKVAPLLQAQAKLYLERSRAESGHLTGTSTAPQLQPGARVRLESMIDRRYDGDYFVVSVEHSGRNGTYIAGDAEETQYSNTYKLLPMSVPYRPAATTPWPAVQGMHLATVVGPSGEEIFTDKFGRVRVVFAWNRAAKTPNGPGDSCWVRVAQMVAGKGWGTFFLPRIGQEVLVSFLGGDPDQPIVMGSCYNDVNLPQIALPDSKTQSAIRTRSSPKGGADNYNELRFEDKKGEEIVEFQAEKDYNALIKNKSTTVIDKGDETRTLNEGNQSLTIKKGNQTVLIEEGNQTETVKKGNQTVAIEQGDQSFTVKQGKQTIKVNGNIATTITTGDHTTKVEAGKSTNEAKQNYTITSRAGKVEITAQVAIELKCGPSSIKISPSGIVLDSPAGIDLKCGPSSLKLSPAGVEAAGLQFKASGSVQAEVSAGAMLTLKGGIVMIN